MPHATSEDCMVRDAMAAPERSRQERERVLVHPNRDKATVRATRAIVLLLLVASIVLMVVITAGGWDALQGAKPIQIVYILLYVTLVIFALRWARGMLPIAAALGIILAIFALVATPGWFNRDHVGYAATGLPASLLGLLTAIVIPVQILLIVFALRGFAQGWNVEEELHDRSAEHDRGAEHDRDFGGAQPHPA